MATMKCLTRAGLLVSRGRLLSTLCCRNIGKTYPKTTSHIFSQNLFKNLQKFNSRQFQPSLSLSTDTSSQKPTKKKPRTVKVTFVDRDGDEITVDAKIGDTLLEVAKEYDVDLEGACEGTLSCSTCHLIVDKNWYEKIPDFLTEEEQDMLDLAFGLTDTSRLGCQIVVSDAIDGIRLKVPTETRDIRNL
ncbi:PREDICTED: uncharacterized protein LOC100641494 [Amphimedon queenslandica]|uniref:2Fe-2S ferredoxin-type domain-containing protein n=1 Tax=Amphimedon queenslandica TaxID=400682 RepID=A0A1X7VIW7_AMPQE|nr:PREDICTED: uncharacterized protein LOC100641494 [Amphimedon queenslandica]|eukprot:XP_003384095.1 PREDICTED: uncharacterized protein LOC100641494 [Amphimedon queenslandica]